ncbi:MAG TPA: cobalamin-dependent protein [bacterium]|nr:cobalamin-dependent protein [bacterium]
MNEPESLLERLKRSVMELDSQALRETMEALITAGVPEQDLRRTLFQELERQRRRMMSDEVPLPRFLICLDLIHDGLDMISPLKEGEAGEGMRLVIGVVEGDPHDLGKNIISKVYAASGYNVRDLGREVLLDSFLKALEDHHARVLALSAMMSTTMSQMPEIIRRVKERFPSVIVMVGGAPLNADLARTFGADGFADSAITLLEETEAAMERAGAGEKW